MSGFKQELNNAGREHGYELTDEQSSRLKATLLDAYLDIADVCERNGIGIMLIGGSVLGAVRHRGFIPWDDDLDAAMTREDFEVFKAIFEQELDDRYVLASPNYAHDARNRFPQILVRGTRLVEPGENPSDPDACIKVDLFIIENVPDSRLARLARGTLCTLLMGAASAASVYQCDDGTLRDFMGATTEGRRLYSHRRLVGRLISFFDTQRWYDLVDRACQYQRQTSLMGIPTGRGHYFGETLPREAFVPMSRGLFEGHEVNLPGDPDAYCKNLYGDYMRIPPENEREGHYITEIRFPTGPVASDSESGQD